MNEQNQNKVDAMVELLESTELSLESFNLIPVADENDEIVGMKLSLESDLMELEEGNDSALKILEDHFINKKYTFKEILEQLVEQGEEE